MHINDLIIIFLGTFSVGWILFCDGGTWGQFGQLGYHYLESVSVGSSLLFRVTENTENTEKTVFIFP